MRIQCDSCEKNLASVMCCADEAALCADCDARIHAVNKLASKHVRVNFLTAPELPKCDICQEKRGFFFCLEDRALLCRGCDVSIHSANALSGNHKRFLVPGTRVALEELKDDLPAEHPMASPAASTMSSQSSHCSRGTSHSSPTSTLQGPRTGGAVQRAPASYTACCPPPGYTSGNGQGVVAEMKAPHHHFGAPDMVSLPSSMGTTGTNMRKSSISEFLTDSVPGWRVDELLSFVDCNEGMNNSTDFAAAAKADCMTVPGGDYDWTADLSLFEEQMFGMHEVPRFPVPAAPQLAQRHHPAPRHVRNRAKQDVYVPNGYDDTFLVPEMRVPSGPAPSPVPKRLKRDLYH